jgi:hypothetical protein
VIDGQARRSYALFQQDHANLPVRPRRALATDAQLRQSLSDLSRPPQEGEHIFRTLSGYLDPVFAGGKFALSFDMHINHKETSWKRNNIHEGLRARPAVIPGRGEDASRESRDSGPGPSDHPGMTSPN